MLEMFKNNLPLLNKNGMTHA